MARTPLLSTLRRLFRGHRAASDLGIAGAKARERALVSRRSRS
jgi:hypothetical protein